MLLISNSNYPEDGDRIATSVGKVIFFANKAMVDALYIRLYIAQLSSSTGVIGPSGIVEVLSLALEGTIY